MKMWITGLAVIALVAAVGISAHKRGQAGGTRDAEDLTFAVRRGPLVISLTESGTIQAQEKIVIKNEISGRTTILSIIDEGTMVKEGDLLVELDSSELEEQLFAQQIKVQNADAVFVKSREDLAITKNQAASDTEKAENTLRFAEQDLEKYIKGEYPQQLREAEVRITLAEEDLQRAEETLKWSRVLFEQKLISQTERQADELAAKKAALDLELARSQMDLLKEHTNKRELAQLKSDAKQASMSLERVQRKAKANILQAEADFAAKEAEFKRQTDKLAEIKEEITMARVLAPSDGLVVYATSTQRRHHHMASNEPLAPGREVREQEPLIHLPDTRKMMAGIKVHESHVKKVTVGMPAHITVDALPNTNFVGYVHHIAPLPDPSSFWSNPDLKIYDTDVYIEDGSEGLRNGMTCEVEVIAETHENALYIPIQSVVRLDGKPTAYAVDEKQVVTPRTISVGADNNRMVHVLGGLEEGELVLLTPPLRDSERETPPLNRKPKTLDRKPSVPDREPTPAAKEAARPSQRPQKVNQGERKRKQQ